MSTDPIGLEGLDNKASSSRSSSPRLSLQNPSSMGLTPEQQQGIDALENVIKTYIVSTDVPKLTVIPEPSETVFPESQYGTGYISSDGQFAVKNINFLKLITRPVPISIESIAESLISELVNYHAISELCPDYFCKLIGYKYDYEKHVLTIVMENCGKDLFEMYSESMKKPQPRVVKNHIGQLINILNCLHENDFVHFDLKLENVVIDKKGTLKLIDAGTLIDINESNFPRVIVRGTSIYMAPELKYIIKIHSENEENTKEKLAKIANNEFLKTTDIYSFGIILIAMVFEPNLGISKVYNDYGVNVFKYWDHFYGPGFSVRTINEEFKKYFGDEIRFEHFFSINRTERLTIQELKSMFEEKMEADKKNPSSPIGQVKRGAEEEPNVFMFRKKTSEGGRKSRCKARCKARCTKTRRGRKSRRQRKSLRSRTK